MSFASGVQGMEEPLLLLSCSGLGSTVTWASHFSIFLPRDNDDGCNNGELQCMLSYRF